MSPNVITQDKWKTVKFVEIHMGIKYSMDGTIEKLKIASLNQQLHILQRQATALKSLVVLLH